MNKLTVSDIKKSAFNLGASAVGICNSSSLTDNMDDMERILPGAKSVIVLTVPHSRTAISSKNIQVGQYDTIHTYEEAAKASHAVARLLENKGYRAVAVPAFIPIDMSPGKNGMVGAIDWRKAAVFAGIGTYGESGLLLTEKNGAAVRIGGVLTDAVLPPEKPLKRSLCTKCMKCIKACPPKALLKNGKVDKKKCGDFIFSGGFRAWKNFLEELMKSGGDKRRELLKSPLSLDLWQNFMTGNYYYCFRCQAVCPVGNPKS